jgi:hypothetical protein
MICPECGHSNPVIAAECLKCRCRFLEHGCFSEQYQHPLVGKRIQVNTRTGCMAEGVVERVVSSRFGLLACLEGENGRAWAVNQCTPVT